MRQIALLVSVVLLVGSAGLAAAQEDTLSGCLETAEDGSLFLTLEDGDEVALEGDDTLADHIGHKVEVTGEWGEEGEVFHVASLEHIAASCD